MQLHQLKPVHRKYPKTRVGRGGKRGTTSGRGQKGQKSRSGHRIRPAERDYIQRLPKLRGYKNRTNKQTRVINVQDLEKRVNGDIIDRVTLPNVEKILGNGEIKKALTIKGLKVSESARKKIEAAGGKIV
jgi:large subunit ribosomal protein L15